MPPIWCARLQAPRAATLLPDPQTQDYATMTETRSTCPYCGVGCGVIIESTGNQITGVKGDPDHPANFGRLCSKGSTLHLTASAPVTLQTRLLQPLRRLQRGRCTAARVVERGTAARHRQVCPDDPRPRAGRRGLLRQRPVAHRRLLRLQQAGQGPDWHQQHRHQLAPVHEQRGGGLQEDAGRRRTAHLLRRCEVCANAVHRRLQHRVCPPHPVPPH